MCCGHFLLHLLKTQFPFFYKQTSLFPHRVLDPHSENKWGAWIKVAAPSVGQRDSTLLLRMRPVASSSHRSGVCFSSLTSRKLVRGLRTRFSRQPRVFRFGGATLCSCFVVGQLRLGLGVNGVSCWAWKQHNHSLERLQTKHSSFADE